MKRLAAAAALVLALALPAGAEDDGAIRPATPAPPPSTQPVLDEIDALKIEKLQAERRMLEVQGENAQLRLELIRRDYAARAAELDRVIEEAAKKAGVDPKDYGPDLQARQWKKRR